MDLTFKIDRLHNFTWKDHKVMLPLHSKFQNKQSLIFDKKSQIWQKKLDVFNISDFLFQNLESRACKA